MDGFALKPFETETIARLLEEARAKRGGARGVDGSPTVGRTPLDTRVFRFVGYDDPEQAGQAARLYLDILDQEVAMLEDALSQHDSAGVAAVAHRIKSHAGLVDAAELRETADRFQREARSAPEATLANLRVELIGHAGLLRERLKSWRDETANE
jgi:HPt (histidine-containing phosphotransfer) domain-containing protein